MGALVYCEPFWRSTASGSAIRGWPRSNRCSTPDVASGRGHPRRAARLAPPGATARRARLGAHRGQLAARPVSARLPRATPRCAATSWCWPGSRCCTSRRATRRSSVGSARRAPAARRRHPRRHRCGGRDLADRGGAARRRTTRRRAGRGGTAWSAVRRAAVSGARHVSRRSPPTSSRIRTLGPHDGVCGDEPSPPRLARRGGARGPPDQPRVGDRGDAGAQDLAVGGERGRLRLPLDLGLHRRPVPLVLRGRRDDRHHRRLGLDPGRRRASGPAQGRGRGLLLGRPLVDAGRCPSKTADKPLAPNGARAAPGHRRRGTSSRVASRTNRTPPAKSPAR